MTVALYFNGTNTGFRTPSLTFTEIIIDMVVEHKTGVGQLYVDARTGIGFAYIQRNAANNDEISTFNAVYIDGVQKTSGTQFVPSNTRCVMRVVKNTAGTDDVNIFSNNGQANGWIKGRIYNIKFYNGAELVAHYDFSTGTALDQSGNGRNATVTNGTFSDDGTGGGTPTGTAVTAIVSTRQTVYANKTAQADTSQKIYKSFLVDYSTKQTVSKVVLVDYLTKQEINKAVSSVIDTLQEITAGSIVRVTDFSLKTVIYKETYSAFATKQQINKFVQSMTDLKQLISRSQALNYETRQIISKGITTHIQTLQRMYESNTLDYGVLIQIINDYKEYKKIIKGDLFIIRSATGELLISQKAKDDIHI